MASYVAPTQLATADDLDVASWNAVAGDVQWLYQAPYLLASANTAQSLPGATQTQLALGATPVSNYGFSLSSNNAVVPLTGVYSVAASGAMAMNSNANACAIGVYHSGTPTLYGSIAVPTTTISATSVASGLILCTAGDTIGLYMYNGIGGPASTDPAPTYLHIFFRGSQ